MEINDLEMKLCSSEWRKGNVKSKERDKACPHALIELFNNENGQLKFNKHIFPWGNIGELLELHLSKADIKGEDAL